MKEHEKLRRIAKKKSTLSRQKKSYRGSKVGFGTLFFKVKNEKIVYKNRSRLARNFILGSNDSQEAMSSEDAEKKIPPRVTSSKWGKKGKNIASSLKLSFSVTLDLRFKPSP